MHVGNKGIIDGLRRGERECIKSRAGDADLWIKIWEEFHLLAAREIVVEVEHAKAHRTKKEKKDMSHFENFVTEGNEKADELAKSGAILDHGFMAEARAETVRQEREEVYAALLYASSFHCLVEEWKDCGEQTQAEAKRKVDYSWTRKGRKRSIERSGVLMSAVLSMSMMVQQEKAVISWQWRIASENDAGNEQCTARNVGVFWVSKEQKRKKDSGSHDFAGKARRDTKSVATRISLSERCLGANAEETQIRDVASTLMIRRRWT